MNLLRKTWVIAIAVMMGACHSETLDIVSPNGNLKITIEPSEKNASGETSFSVAYKEKNILSGSRLGLETDVQKLAGNLKLKEVSA